VGFAINETGLPVFGGTEMVFGSVASLVTAILFGPWSGGLAGLIAFAGTWARWQHPAGIICFTLEAVVVGWLVNRRKVGPFRAVMLYWGCVGAPLVAALVGWWLTDIPFPANWAIVLKYPVNGLIVAAVAVPLQNWAGLRRWLGLPLADESDTQLRLVLFRRIGVITALPLVLLILLFGRVFDGTTRTEAEKKLQGHARELADLIDNHLAEHQRDLVALGQLLTRQDMTPESVAADLETILRQHPGFLTLLLADRSGTIVASAPRQDESGRSISRQGISVSDREYFQVPMRTGKSHVSGVFKGRGFGSDLIVAVSTPILDQTGRPLYLLEGSLDLRVITQNIRQDIRYRNRDVIIADQAGKIVLSAGQIVLTPETDLLAHPQFAGLEYTEQVAHYARRPETGGRPQRNAVVNVLTPRFNWRVMLFEPVWASQRTIAGFYLVAGAWALLALCLSLLLARSLSSQITVPLQILAKTTAQLARREPASVTSSPFPAREFTVISQDLRSTASSLVESNTALARAIGERDKSYRQLRSTLLHLEDRIQKRTLQLEDARRAAESANQAKSEFLASTSHELRTPLNVILGMSEVLREKTMGPLNAKQLEGICCVEESGRHLLSVITDILDLSKIEAGKLQLNLQETVVRDVCESSLRFVQDSAHRKIITVESAYGTGDWHIQADIRRLKQVLVNLLSNAVKFTPEGGHIRLEVRPDSAGRSLQLSVRDTGIGISPEDLPKLFHPFQQVDSALNRRFTGTGLGLALVRRMTELHGGTVAVESEPGRGATFTVTLPLPTTDAPAARALPSNSLPPVRPARFPREPLVLVAEDNLGNRLMLENHLLSRGCRLAFADDGQQALLLAASLRPEIILMDIQMPVIDGLEATRRLQANPSLAGIPVIIITALAMPEDRARSLAAGAKGYLSKPVNLRELDALILQLLAPPPPA
jgi:signal transduction histidine kinase/CheY-like chemotaxis protein